MLNVQQRLLGQGGVSSSQAKLNVGGSQGGIENSLQPNESFAASLILDLERARVDVRQPEVSVGLNLLDVDSKASGNAPVEDVNEVHWPNTNDRKL